MFGKYGLKKIVIYVKRIPKCTFGKSVYMLLSSNDASQHICHNIRLGLLLNCRKSLS